MKKPLFKSRTIRTDTMHITYQSEADNVEMGPISKKEEHTFYGVSLFNVLHGSYLELGVDNIQFLKLNLNKDIGKKRNSFDIVKIPYDEYSHKLFIVYQTYSGIQVDCFEINHQMFSSCKKKIFSISLSEFNKILDTALSYIQPPVRKRKCTHS